MKKIGWYGLLKIFCVGNGVTAVLEVGISGIGDEAMEVGVEVVLTVVNVPLIVVLVLLLVVI